MTTKTKKFDLQYKRSTPGTHLFVNDDEVTPFTTTMYVRRDQMQKASESITVTVEYKED